jgi:phage virion morphogenesis protein
MGAAGMNDRLEALEDWAAGLLGQLEPASRNTLARSVGQALRRSQQQRIIAQQNPDGSKYAPRRQRNLRGKQGRLKRKMKMFQKLRKAKFMKMQGAGDAIRIGFTGRIARITHIHQFGLKDRAERNAPDTQYHRREILGFTNADFHCIRVTILDHMTNT